MPRRKKKNILSQLLGGFTGSTPYKPQVPKRTNKSHERVRTEIATERKLRVQEEKRASKHRTKEMAKRAKASSRVLKKAFHKLW
jgi:hypothetical protein